LTRTRSALKTAAIGSGSAWAPSIESEGERRPAATIRERRAQDPEYVERRRANNRRYWERKRTDGLPPL